MEPQNPPEITSPSAPILPDEKKPIGKLVLLVGIGVVIAGGLFWYFINNQNTSIVSKSPEETVTNYLSALKEGNYSQAKKFITSELATGEVVQRQFSTVLKPDTFEIKKNRLTR